VTFADGSELRQIEEGAFDDMHRIESIRLPRSIEQLDEKWALPTSFEKVVFECRDSHQRVIQRNVRCLGGFRQADSATQAEELIFVRCS
jgi:hypothetical protein